MDKKSPPNFALLIGKRLGDKPTDAPADDGGDDSKPGDKKEQMLSSAFSSIADAIKSGDTEAGKEALCQFLEMYEGDDESPSKDEEVGPPPDDME